MFGYSTPSEKLAADRYLEHLNELRHHYGFGFIERKRRVREPRAAAAYLSSYFINGKGRKASLEESVQSNWMPRSIIYVSTKLTQRSQVTMRTLRLGRFAWIVWRDHFADDPACDEITPLLIWKNFISGQIQPAKFAGDL